MENSPEPKERGIRLYIYKQPYQRKKWVDISLISTLANRKFLETSQVKNQIEVEINYIAEGMKKKMLKNSKSSGEDGITNKMMWRAHIMRNNFM